MSAALDLYCSDAVRRLDAAEIARGTPAGELMERAGAAALDLIRSRWPTAQHLLVCCGPGNNGGDGYVVARRAHEAGMAVRVIGLAATASTSAVARDKRAQWEMRGPVLPAATAATFADAEVVVDALYGIGVRRALAGAAVELVAAINGQRAPVLALDVPSGLDADLGSAPGVAVQADCTLCFVALKRGLLTGQGRALAGRVLLDRIGIRAHPDDPSADACVVDSALAAALLTRRRDDAYKGSFGNVLVVGGDLGMGGAVRLTAEAALRCGAGLVSIFTRPLHVPAILAARPECMALGDDRAQVPAQLLARASVLALGPGLGREDWGADLFAQGLAYVGPRVFDADALFHLARCPQPLSDTILTPHAGEAARLLGCDPVQINADRYGSARDLARRYRSVVVLKGNGSLIADPIGRVEVVTAGNPGLATAGSGDVLTGVIAALRAQGLGAFDAARLGALLHAQVGDDAAASGQRGLLAGDLLAPLRQRVNP